VAAWGYNDDGELGDNFTSVFDSSVPVAVDTTGVLAGRTVVAVAVGYSHSVALCADGTVAARGLNSEGELGNNSTTQSPAPVAVTSTPLSSGERFTGVFRSAVGRHSLALVSAAPPSALTYSANPVAYSRGTAIANNTPSSGGSGVVAYSVAPALPAGLSLNPNTGVISGTPTAVTAAASYTVTATNAAGSITAALSLTVNEAAPTALTYSANPAVYPVGTAIANNTPSSGGGAVAAYSVAPAPPAGLSLNTVNGIISGTPTARAAAANYTVTSTNTGGSATVSLNLTVESSIESWRRTWYGAPNNTGNAADNANPYGTGVPNLVVFAFFGPNQNPALAQASLLPRVQRSGGNLFFSFTQPTGVSGITYGGESSFTLAPGSWTTVPDTGTGSQHRFSIPIGPAPLRFLRLAVTDNPVPMGWNFTDLDATFDTGTLANFAVGTMSIANSYGTVATPINNVSASSGYAGASGGGNMGNAVHGGAFTNGVSPYFAVTITPAAGYGVRVTRFDFGMRSSATGATAYALYSSVDNYAGPLFTGSNAADSVWTLKSNPAFSVSGALNTAVTFRLYTYGGLTTGASGTINSRVDDIAITVTATAP
jgi:hypothetical protein